MKAQLSNIDPQLLSSMIEAFGVIVAAVITVIGLVFTSLTVIDKKKTLQQLVVAYRDLRVYQEAEIVYNEIEIGRGEPSNQRKVRDIVFREQGIRASGTNSPAQVERKLDQLDSIGG